MKGTILFLSLILAAGCSKQKESEPDSRLSIFASIPPQVSLIQAIAGDRAAVHTLVGNGQSPHSYEPRARQLVQLGEADLLFTIGVPFETALLKKIQPLYPNLAVQPTQNKIQMRSMPHVHHGELCSHEHGQQDPHVWLTPLNALALAERITEELEKADSDHAAVYRQNFSTLADQLKALDSEIEQKLAPFNGSRFYVFHPSFGYFADRYGLKEVPIELDGKAPTPRQLADLVDQAKADGVKVIFVQKQFSVESARAMANAIGGSVLPLDPLAEDVVANLRQIADTIVSALEH